MEKSQRGPVRQVRGFLSSIGGELQTLTTGLHCDTVNSCFFSKNFRALRRAERRSAQGQRRWPLHVWLRLRRAALHLPCLSLITRHLSLPLRGCTLPDGYSIIHDTGQLNLPRSPMRACPQCQRTYPDDTDFCPRDGAPLRRGTPRGCPRTATRTAPCSSGLRPPERCRSADLEVSTCRPQGRRYKYHRAIPALRGKLQSPLQPWDFPL